MNFSCPICHKAITAVSKERFERLEFFPFCSRRCKLIDLGVWLDGDYKIVSGLYAEESGKNRRASFETAADTTDNKA